MRLLQQSFIRLNDKELFCVPVALLYYHFIDIHGTRTRNPTNNYYFPLNNRMDFIILILSRTRTILYMQYAQWNTNENEISKSVKMFYNKLSAERQQVIKCCFQTL